MKRLFTAASGILTAAKPLCRDSLGWRKGNGFLSFMDKTALVQTLVTSEKNRTIVKIKTVNGGKPITGAVQKVLNQVIILKSAADQSITLTFSDIESVINGEPKVALSASGFMGMLGRLFNKPAT